MFFNIDNRKKPVQLEQFSWMRMHYLHGNTKKVYNIHVRSYMYFIRAFSKRFELGCIYNI